MTTDESSSVSYKQSVKAPTRHFTGVKCSTVGKQRPEKLDCRWLK